MSIRISIRNDFSRTPGVRSRVQGNYSGEQFREELLYPKFMEAITTGQKLEVVLDGTTGNGPSFLEEAFGGLVRQIEPKYGAKKATELVSSNLVIISKEEEYLVDDIKSYIQKALADVLI